MRLRIGRAVTRTSAMLALPRSVWRGWALALARRLPEPLRRRFSNRPG